MSATHICPDSLHFETFLMIVMMSHPLIGNLSKAETPAWINNNKFGCIAWNNLPWVFKRDLNCDRWLHQESNIRFTKSTICLVSGQVWILQVVAVHGMQVWMQVTSWCVCMQHNHRSVLMLTSSIAHEDWRCFADNQAVSRLMSWILSPKAELVCSYITFW